MSKYSYLYSDLIFSLQQLISQPAARRSAAFVGIAGFTIVELLIVIVVIGVLAAIIIVAYTGVTNSAKETSIKSDLVNIAKKMGEFNARNGYYPSYATSDLDAVDIKIKQTNYVTGRNNVYYCRSNDNNHYSVGVDTSNNTEYFILDGTQTLVPNGSVDGAKTCKYLTDNGFPAPSTGGPAAYGWNASTNQGSWVRWGQ